MLEHLSARAEVELLELSANGLIGQPISNIRASIPAALRLGFQEDAEGLLDIFVENKVPRVVRYDLKAIIIGAVNLIGGLQAGILGTIIALAGLWELMGSRERLSPSACFLVWLLAQDNKQEISLAILEDSWRMLYQQIAGREPVQGEFAAVLSDLENKEIVEVSSKGAVLKERFYITIGGQ